MLCVCTLSGIAGRLCQLTSNSFLAIECEYRKILVVHQIDTGIEDKREYTYIILVNGFTRLLTIHCLQTHTFSFVCPDELVYYPSA